MTNVIIFQFQKYIITTKLKKNKFRGPVTWNDKTKNVISLKKKSTSGDSLLTDSFISTFNLSLISASSVLFGRDLSRSTLDSFACASSSSLFTAES